MRMLMTVTFPHEPFNTLVRAGTVDDIMRKILAELKPESVYFVEARGKRCAVLAIEISHQSQLPSFAEPFFLNFNAECRFRIAMSPEDLEKAGLEKLGQKWK